MKAISEQPFLNRMNPVFTFRSILDSHNEEINPKVFSDMKRQSKMGTVINNLGRARVKSFAQNQSPTDYDPNGSRSSFKHLTVNLLHVTNKWYCCDVITIRTQELGLNLRLIGSAFLLQNCPILPMSKNFMETTLDYIKATLMKSSCKEK